MARSTFVGERLDTMEARLKEAEAALREPAARDPEHPCEDVPDGPDESGNVVVRQSGEPPVLGFEPKPHWELGEALGIIDFERGVKLAGTRFYVLKGAGRSAATCTHLWMMDATSLAATRRSTRRR